MVEAEAGAAAAGEAAEVEGEDGNTRHIMIFLACGTKHLEALYYLMFHLILWRKFSLVLL